MIFQKAALRRAHFISKMSPFLCVFFDFLCISAFDFFGKGVRDGGSDSFEMFCELR